MSDQLKELFVEICAIKKYSLEYSYSSDIPQNGFTSFVKIISLYFDRLLEYSRSVNGHQETSYKHLQDMLALLPLLLTQLNALKLVRRQSKADPSTKLELEIEILQEMSRIDESTMLPFFEEACLAFWLPESFKKIARRETRRSVETFYRKIYEETDENLLCKLSADYTINSYIGDAVKEIRSARKPEKRVTPVGLKMQNFTLEHRQTEWMIDPISRSLVHKAKRDDPSKRIKFVIFSGEERKTDTVIYQIHGGTWIMGSPDSYTSIIDRWIREIGACVVSIDYSLAPESAYPVALQEVIDGYLWLDDLTMDDTRESPLSFRPSNIVVAGDSAGGNLGLSLAIALAEMKRSGGQVNLPKAMSILYPCASPGLPYESASMILFDPVYPCNLPLKYTCCYIEENTFDLTESYLLGKKNPWFKNEAILRDLYKKVNADRHRDPIFHVLSYTEFQSLSSVPLWIQVGEYDGLVDCCISIAKVWQGPVILDIIPDMIHTFAKLTQDSPECRQADKLATERLKEAVLK